MPEKAVLKVFPFCKFLQVGLKHLCILHRFLKVLHLPDWLPGSWIKREAKVARELGAKMVEGPYQYAQKHMVGLVCLVCELAENELLLF